MAYPHQTVPELSSMGAGQADALDVLRRAALWFEPNDDGFGPLLDAIGDASLVLIGEASHGTHEFYRTRAGLTKALVRRKAFNIVAVEADWPERLFHDLGVQQFHLPLRDAATQSALSPRLERAIGVIYRPDTQRMSHYFRARLAAQFDAILHIDETHGLEPLEAWSRDEADLPETYPSAF